MVELQAPAGARERDVRQSPFGLDAFPARLRFGVDGDRARVRQGAVVAREDDDVRPLAALRAVDRRKLDAVLVADRHKRPGLAAKLLEVRADRHAARLLGGLLEDLGLEVVRAARRVTLRKPVLQAAGPAQ